MEFIVLDLNTATEDQIKAAIDCNNRTSRLMNSEIDKLRRVAESAKKSKKTFLLQEETKEPEQEKEEIDQDFENEVGYYLAQVQELKLSNIEDEFEMAIPSKMAISVLPLFCAFHRFVPTGKQFCPLFLFHCTFKI